MNLTATEFARLIADLKTDTRPSELRKSPRVPVWSKIEGIAIHEPKPKRITFRIRDISRSGMGLLSSAPWTLQTRLVLLLPHEKSFFVLLASVARCQAVARDQYLLGVSMLRKLSADEYELIMSGDPECTVRLQSEKLAA